MKIEEILEVLDYCSITQEEVDGIVIDLHLAEASRMNNEGLHEQVTYIVNAVGEKQAMKLLGFCEHGYYHGRSCRECERWEYADHARDRDMDR